MAYRSHTASPAGSASPSSSSSTNASPYIGTSPLDNMLSHDDADSAYSSAQGTPNHSTTSLPRSLSAGKGGCWTCRVRRKKCDEQREGDSCRTCKRLTIKCLGWGAKRPDWMRDKKNVDAYKASIKAQLSSKGLIRGQPRHNPLQISAHRSLSGGGRHASLSAHGGMHGHGRYDAYARTLDQGYGPSAHELLMSAQPGATNAGFEHLTRSLEAFNPETSFHYSQPLSTMPYHQTLEPDQFGLMPAPADALTFDHAAQYNFPAGQSGGQSELVMHYFENVRKVQPFCAGDALTDSTYTAVVEDPHGAVTLAICALADLHLKQVRVSQGLEAPNSSETSHATYLKNEALFRLETNKTANGFHTDHDAIAALHLLSLSQLSGGGSDWETPFAILCQWLLEKNLHRADDPLLAFHNLGPVAQLYVKVTLWLDVFSSLSVTRPPKFMVLWQRLLGEQGMFWGGELEMPRRLRMDILTGCPDEAMMAIAEISSLAHWKAGQLRNGCLSYVELVQRGTAIEQVLTRYPSDAAATTGTHDAPHSRLHSSAGAAPSEEQHLLMASIFREAAKLYLHTVLSNSTPGVPEISRSVDVIVRLFTQLPPSELDRSLIFPICLAGCMTNDSTKRDFFKSRIRALNENYGNLLPTRRLMEAVWQKRDVGGKEIDMRETIREQGLKLLLI